MADEDDKVRITAVGAVAGVPNANGDVFTEEALRNAAAKMADEIGTPQAVRVTTTKPTEADIAMHQAKHRIAPYGMEPNWVTNAFGGYRRWSSFTQRTLTREYTRDFPWGCRVTIKPDRTVTMRKIGGLEEPFNVVDMPFDQMQDVVEFLNCPMAPAKPYGFKEMEERITKAIDEAKASGQPIEMFAVDSVSMTGRQTGKTALMTEIMKANPCASIRGRGKSTLTLDTLKAAGHWTWQREKVPGETDKGLQESAVTFEEALRLYTERNDEVTPVDLIVNRMWQAFYRGIPLAVIVSEPVEHTEYLLPPRYTGCAEVDLPEGTEPQRMLTEDWGYGPLTQDKPTKCSFNYALELLSQHHLPCEPKTAAQLRAEMKKAYLDQTAITLNLVPEGEILIVPPDDYPPDQKFVCQQCGQEYLYGPAKSKMLPYPFRNTLGHKYHPLVFCCIDHEEVYLRKHRRYPAVGAEIMLGKPEMCNLHYDKWTDEQKAAYHAAVNASEAKVLDPANAKPVGTCYTEVHHMPNDPLGLDTLVGSFNLEPVGPTLIVDQAVTMSRDERDAQRRSWVRGQMKMKYPDMPDAELERRIDEALGKNPVEELFRDREQK